MTGGAKIPWSFDATLNYPCAEKMCPPLHACGVTPNQVTVMCIVCKSVMVVSLARGRVGVAVGAFLMERLLDALDGHMARKYHEQSRFGALLDSASDKAFFAALAAVSFARTWHTEQRPMFYSLVTVMGLALAGDGMPRHTFLGTVSDVIQENAAPIVLTYLVVMRAAFETNGGKS